MKYYSNDFRNITVNLQQQEQVQLQNVAIFRQLPLVGNLHLTINSLINASSLELTAFCQFKEVYPLELTYNIDDSTLINNIYGFQKTIIDVQSFDSIKMEINVNNSNTYVFALGNTVEQSEYYQTIRFDQVIVSGTVAAKQYRFIYQLNIGVDIQYYLYNALVYMQSTGDAYVYSYRVQNTSIIQNLVVYGSLIGRSNQAYIVYNQVYNQDIGDSMIIQNVVQNVSSNIQQLYQETPITRPTLNLTNPFQLSDSNNQDLLYSLQNSIYYQNIDIIIPLCQIQENKQYSLFYLVQNNVQNVQITYQMVDISNGKFFGLSFNTDKNIEIQNFNMYITVNSEQTTGSGQVYMLQSQQLSGLLQLNSVQIDAKIQKSEAFTFYGLAETFFSNLQSQQLQYNLDISGVNVKSYVLGQQILQDSIIVVNNMNMNIYADKQQDNTSLSYFQYSEEQTQSSMNIDIISYRNIQISKSESENWINTVYKQPQIILTDDDLQCENDICYYIDTDYIENYNIQGKLNPTTQSAATKLYLFKQEVQTSQNTQIQLQIESISDQFQQFQVFSTEQDTVNAYSIILNLSLGNTNFNGLVSQQISEINIQVNQYKVYINGNGNIYGIFNEQTSDVIITIQTYVFDAPIVNGYVAGIANIASQSVQFTTQLYQYKTQTSIDKSSIYFIQMNSEQISINVNQLSAQQESYACPYVVSDQEDQIGDEFLQQFQCPGQDTLVQQLTVQEFSQQYSDSHKTFNYIINSSEIENGTTYIISFEVQQQYENASLVYATSQLSDVTFKTVQTNTINNINSLSFVQITQESTIQQINRLQFTLDIVNENGKIVLIDNYYGNNIQFNSISVQETQLSGLYVSTIGSVNTQIQISLLTVQKSQYICQNGSFGIYETLINSNMILQQSQIDSQSTLQTQQMGGAILALVQDGTVSIQNTVIEAHLQLNGYQSGAIVGLVKAGQVDLNTVSFSVNDGQRTYQSCPTNINSIQLNSQESVICPEIREFTYEASTLQTRSISLLYFRNQYYLYDQGDYNDSNINYEGIESYKSQYDANPLVSMFSNNYKDSSSFQNIQLQVFQQLHQYSNCYSGLVGFISQQSKNNLVFYNCQSQLNLQVKYTANSAIKGTYYSGFILVQDNQVQKTSFVNCASQMIFGQYGGSKTSSGANMSQFQGYVNTTSTNALLINNYINCYSTINITDNKIQMHMYPYQQSTQCNYATVNDYSEYVLLDGEQAHDQTCQEDQTLLEYLQ